MRNHDSFFFNALLLILLSAFVPASYATHSKFTFDLSQVSSVEEAVEIVSKKLTKEGYKIELVVDHAAGAASVGLELRPTQVIFAQPPRSLERQLLRRGTTVGLDLPLKFLVFEDANDTVQLRYNPAGYLVDRHDITLNDRPLRQIQKISNRFGDNEDGLVTIESLCSVDDTVLALQTAISANPAFRIPLVLDYDGRDGDGKGPVLIVFGNPTVGTPLMQTTQEVAIDLPQKYLVWSDKKGRVFITYNDPLFIGKRHNVQGHDARLEAISNALRNFAEQGAGIN